MSDRAEYRHQFANVLVTLNYNDAETTTRFLENIRKLDSIDHVVVVDNRSTDGSYLKLSACADDRVDVVQTASNGGYAKGNNFGAWYGIEKYDPDYLLISNPDVVFTDEIVRGMEEAIMRRPDSGAVACRMKCLSGAPLPSAWKLPRFSDCVKENLIVVKKILGDKTRYDDHYLQSAPEVKVDVVPGSFFGISRRAFADVGGFDESTFLYGEENLLAFKLREKGYQSRLITDREFLHEHSASIDKSVKSLYRKLRMGLDSRLIYARKCLKVKRAGEAILRLTFHIGAFNYLVLRKLLGMAKRRP